MIFRLALPGRIVEDGRERAKFDIDKGRSHLIDQLFSHVALEFPTAFKL